MKTEIYENHAAFEAREDKSTNGVTAEFAAKHSSWSKERNNRACWCCLDCESCIACAHCVTCHRCIDCVACCECRRCKGSAWLSQGSEVTCMLGHEGYRILHNLACGSVTSVAEDAYAGLPCAQ